MLITGRVDSDLELVRVVAKVWTASITVIFSLTTTGQVEQDRQRSRLALGESELKKQKEVIQTVGKF